VTIFGACKVITYKKEKSMITTKQRAYLRKLANDIKPILQVGKGGISENTIKQFDEALEARELIKASVLKSSTDDSYGVCNELAKKLNAQVVQVVGSKFVLYRESKENPLINIP
jgi:RNA-binding protein